MVERVKLDDELKPIKSPEYIKIFLGWVTLITIIIGYVAIWSGGIWIKIFLTMLLSVFILHGLEKAQ